MADHARRLLRVLAFASSCAGLLLIRTAGGARLNLLPERQHPPALEGRVWGPLVAAIHLLLILAVVRGLLELVWPVIGPRLPGPLRRWWLPRERPPAEPGPPAAARFGVASSSAGSHAGSSPSFDWWDALLVAVLLILHTSILIAYQREYNPEWRVIGNDHYSFLAVIVAIGTGRWELYNGDKRPLYGIASGWLGRLLDGDYIFAGQLVAMAASILVQVPTYLTGRLLCGRLIGLGAGIMLMAVPLLYPYATETGSYAFFSLVANGMVLSTALALTRRGFSHYLLAGVAAGLGFLTQVKGFTLVLPLVGVLAAGALIDRAGRRLARLGALVVPVALSFLVLELYPVTFTPLSVLIMHHREEVHVEVPYQWQSTRVPDPAAPSPISHRLPRFLRGGELEALAAVMLAPPDSDVYAAFPDGARRQWRVMPGTSIPPLEVRIRHNLAQAEALAPGLARLLVPFAAGGILCLLYTHPGLVGSGGSSPPDRNDNSGETGTSERLPAPGGDSDSEARPPPPGRRLRARAASWLRDGGWHPLVLLIPLASTIGSLSLKFNFRYLMHALPAALLLVAAGIIGMARLLLPSPGPAWRHLRTLVALGLIGAVAVTLFNRAPYLRSHLTREMVVRLFSNLPRDHRQLIGKGMALVADHVREHLPANARIYDCAHIALTLYLPTDSRLILERSDSERDQRCREVLSSPTDDIPTWMFVNSVPEFAGPDAVTAGEVARQPGWALEYGYTEVGPLELTGPELGLPGSGALVLFRREGSAPAPASPHSHLAGGPAGIEGLDPQQPGQ